MLPRTAETIIEVLVHGATTATESVMTALLSLGLVAITLLAMLPTRSGFLA